MTTSQSSGAVASSSEGRGKKLLDRALDALQAAGFHSADATGYVSSMRQYILFHDKRHPQEVGIPEVDAFLASKTFAGPVGASNRGVARQAIQFLYRDALHRRWPRSMARPNGGGRKKRFTSTSNRSVTQRSRASRTCVTKPELAGAW